MDADGLYDKLKNAGPTCKSLVKKYLTQPLFDKLKKKTTDYGGTLAHCIRSGRLFHFFFTFLTVRSFFHSFLLSLFSDYFYFFI